MKEKVMKVSPSKSKQLWAGIEEDAFLVEKGISDVEIADFSLENMTYFFANTNYFRQMIRISDGLKPVQRRALYSLYKGKIYGGKRAKSLTIVGDTNKLHAHSDIATYDAIVALAQRWKNPVPLIAGKGNFGNERGDRNAAARYTEASMSAYGYECFFSDYDPDCVETLHNTASDTEETMTLPSKFPNILVNGGTGFAPCNAFNVPPFNINDIIDAVKKVLKEPNGGDIYLVPDLPTGCPIVDVDGALDKIAETGVGTITMRSDIIIEEIKRDRKRCWALKVRNIPWMVSLRSVRKRLEELKANGQLQYDDIDDHSYAVRRKDGTTGLEIDFWIILNHAQDPYAIRNKVYKMTNLSKSIAVDLKAVVDELKVRRFPMRALLQAWIDERRSYKRRLYNKKIVHLNERIDLLTVLIDALSPEKINKTIKIVRSCTDDELYTALATHANMTTYQAKQLSETPIKSLTKEARERFIAELPKRIAERDEVEEIIRSEKKIDQIIMDEMEDLRKYGSPRRSRLIKGDGSGETIADTYHKLIVTDQGYVKKLPFDKDKPNHLDIGTLSPGDFVTIVMTVHNRDSITFFDSNGRYSSVPIHMIDNTTPNSVGHRAYDIAKLEGKIVQVIPNFKNSQMEKMRKKFKDVYLVFLTKNGYLKRSRIEEYIKISSVRNVRGVKVKKDDSLVFAAVMFGDPDVMIYTKRGNCTYVSMSEFEPSRKDTMGLIALNPDADDECIRMSIIPKEASHIAVITNKGLIKKCELQYCGSTTKRRGSVFSLITLDATDSLFNVCALEENYDITVITMNDVFVILNDEIPTLTRKAKGKKMIPVPLGDRIICADASVLNTNK